MSRIPSVHIDNLQPEIAVGTSPILHFPISPGCFHPTASKRQEYANIVRERVNTMLFYERQCIKRRDQHLSPLDTREWKLVQTSKELRFYKQVRGDRTVEQLASEETLLDVRQAVENGYPAMLCTGQLLGSMEDVMYGMTASSQEDLMTVFSFRNAPKDCVWLGTAEGPTPEDPFHSADFIWAMPKVTAYAVDTCYLKATGVETDQDGKRYGYLILHSVELPQCRPFEARGVSRVKMYFSCLFRDISHGGLNVTVRGIFDLGKRTSKIAKKLITLSIKSFTVGLLNCVGIGLAKKFTLMARRNSIKLQRPKQTECSLCYQTKKRSLFGLKTHLVQCGVCGATACSNCIANTKQILFVGLGAQRSKRPCCFVCMRDARVTCGVVPGDPEFQVVADFYLQQRSQSLQPSSSPVSVTFQSSLIEMYPLDTVTRTRGSRSRSVLKTCLSADMPTNSTAADSLDMDPFEFDEVDFCSSEDGSTNSAVTQPDSRVILPSDSDESTVTLWHGTHRMHVNDFIPTTAKAPPHSEFKLLQTLFQLNVKAERTFMQTLATGRGLRGAELD